METDVKKNIIRLSVDYCTGFCYYFTLQAKGVTISTSKNITVCSLHLPHSENLNIVLLNRLIDQLPTPFVICGDFNGHSMTWGCDKNNSRGDLITETICVYLMMVYIFAPSHRDIHIH